MTATTRLTLLAGVLLLIAATGAFISAVSLSGGDDGPALDAETASATDGAIARLQTSLAQRPDDGESYVGLGFAYLQKARETGDPSWYGRSERAFQSALGLIPGSAEALGGLSAVAAARHDFDAALEFAQQAPQNDPDTLAVLGDALIELGRYDEAFAAYESLGTIRPDAGAYTRIAYARELTGDVEGAIEAMQTAVDSTAPSGEASAWIRYQLGNLYFNSGDTIRASAEYERSLEGLPGYVHAVAGLARVSVAEGDLARGLELYSEVVARQPVLEHVIALGEVYEAAADDEAANEQFALARAIRELYEANGSSTDLEVALFEADHGDPQAALALARAANEARPGIHAADTLAWALYRAGQYDEAAAYTEKALSLGTRDALILYHAGMIAEAQGDEEAARTHLADALQVNPHFSVVHSSEAAETLERLNASVRQ
jgi:tetratricopeptide (TPR) repeat protein